MIHAGAWSGREGRCRRERGGGAACGRPDMRIGRFLETQHPRRGRLGANGLEVVTAVIGRELR